MLTLSFKAVRVAQILALTQARFFRGSISRNLVIGGGEAEKGRHPYIVSLQNDLEHFCGASLIAPDVVLTAAHCVSPDTVAVIGRHYWNENKGEKCEISDFIRHPGFDMSEGSFDNDIMLLILDRPASEEFPIVKLNSDPLVPKVQSAVSVMGWGDTNIDWLKFEMSDALKSAEVIVQSNEECAASQGEIRGDPHWYEGHLTKNMLCAEAKGADACQTDSGGPLIVLGESHKEDIQVGIVSWGYECAHKHFPGVYTRVSNYYPWIREKVCEKSSSPPDSFQCSAQDGIVEEKLSMEISFENDDERTVEIEVDFEE